MRGTVFLSSTEVNTVTLKGTGDTYATCQFDVFPSDLERGETVTFKGVVSGYIMEVNFEHCTVVATSPRRGKPLPK